MSPFLDHETSIEVADGQKYVSDGKKIYFAGEEDGHSPSHAQLARKLGVPKTDFHGNPFVVAAGEIFNTDEKFSFSIKTNSCHIIGDSTHKAVEAINKSAKKILGEDKVY